LELRHWLDTTLGIEHTVCYDPGYASSILGGTPSSGGVPDSGFISSYLQVLANVLFSSRTWKWETKAQTSRTAMLEIKLYCYEANVLSLRYGNVCQMLQR
jgi:hypothetical protein